MKMTNASSMTRRPAYRSVLLAAVGMLSLVVALSWAGTARADFVFDEAGVGLNDPPAIDDQETPFAGDDFPFVNSDGTFVDPTFTRQAGAHPDLTVYFRAGTDSSSFPLEA